MKSVRELFRGKLVIVGVDTGKDQTHIHLENMPHSHVIGIIVTIPTEVAEEYDLREGAEWTS
jgi:molybdopterin-binding protein